MWKWVRRILLGIGAIVVLAIAGVLVKFYVLSPKVRPAAAMTAPSTPEAIARGQYLARDLCGCVTCHSKVDEMKPGSLVVGPLFGGRDWSQEVGFPLAASNLTFDKGSGLGNWTDGEVVRAIREGVSHDGRPLFPMMPYRIFAETLTDDDALAIVAYLKSLPPAQASLPKTKPPFPMSMIIRDIPPAPPPLAAVPAKGTEAYDSWILKTALCRNCHDTMNEFHDTLPGMDYGGGELMSDGEHKLYAPNITPDPTTGIGTYSEEDIIRVLDGTSKSGKPIMIMPTNNYKDLPLDDKKALVRALKRLKPVVHQVPAP